MGQFTTTLLLGSRVLVQGTDVNSVTGTTVVDSTQWEEVNSHREYSLAADEFDVAVEAFFAPLTEAADKIKGHGLNKPTDSTSYVVLHEEVEPTPGTPGVVVELSKDSIILRVIEEGNTDRLVWVGGGLEVVAGSAPVADEATAGDVFRGDG